MDASPLIHGLLALPDPRLRVAWLHERAERVGPDQMAREIDRVAAENERSESRAREAMLAIASWLVGPAAGAWVEALRASARAGRHLALRRLIRRIPSAPLVTGARPLGAVPDYGAGRELSVGERRSLARRPNRRAFERLLRDPHPLVIRQLLGNSHLTEEDVMRLATRRPAAVETLVELARRPEWLARRRVRLALLLNPWTPPWVALPLVATCAREDLRQVVASTEVPRALAAAARELLERRPPLPQPADPVLH